MRDLPELLDRVRACRTCADHLPLGPRPVVRMAPTARLLIIGQAPGTKVHASGVPWDDPSGVRLRDWLDLGPDVFYDETRVAIMPMGFCYQGIKRHVAHASRVAIMPMGFCYPGRDPRGGDNPPRPECAPQWHDALRAHLPEIRLNLLIGGYAQKHHLGPRARRTMTETVAHWHDCAPDIIPTPHLSWRTTHWMKKNPWFESDLVPVLRRAVAEALA